MLPYGVIKNNNNNNNDYIKVKDAKSIWYLKYQIPSPQKVVGKVFKCPQINMYLVFYLNTSFWVLDPTLHTLKNLVMIRTLFSPEPSTKNKCQIARHTPEDRRQFSGTTIQSTSHGHQTLLQTFSTFSRCGPHGNSKLGWRTPQSSPWTLLNGKLCAQSLF